MAEGGLESKEYLTYIAEDSGNVAADGNFSVQVRMCVAQQCLYSHVVIPHRRICTARPVGVDKFAFKHVP